MEAGTPIGRSEKQQNVILKEPKRVKDPLATTQPRKSAACKRIRSSESAGGQRIHRRGAEERREFRRPRTANRISTLRVFLLKTVDFRPV